MHIYILLYYVLYIYISYNIYIHIHISKIKITHTDWHWAQKGQGSTEEWLYSRAIVDFGWFWRYRQLSGHLIMISQFIASQKLKQINFDKCNCFWWCLVISSWILGWLVSFVFHNARRENKQSFVLDPWPGHLMFFTIRCCWWLTGMAPPGMYFQVSNGEKTTSKLVIPNSMELPTLKTQDMELIGSPLTHARFNRRSGWIRMVVSHTEFKRICFVSFCF